MLERHIQIYFVKMYLNAASVHHLESVDATALRERYQFLRNLVGPEDLDECLTEVARTEDYLTSKDGLVYALERTKSLQQQNDDARLALRGPIDRYQDAILNSLPLDFVAANKKSDPGWDLLKVRFFGNRAVLLVEQADALRTLREHFGNASSKQSVKEAIETYFQQSEAVFGWQIQKYEDSPGFPTPTVHCTVKIPELAKPVELTVYTVASDKELELFRSVASLDASRDVAVLYLRDDSAPLVNLHVEGRSIIRLPIGMMLTVASSRSAPDRFREEILKQANLELISPYRSRGAIHSNMFYGRVTELALLINQKDGCSALYGPRRIGKTSLVHRVKYLAEHENPARDIPRYLDCALYMTSGDGLEEIANEFGFDWAKEQSYVRFVRSAKRFRDEHIPEGKLLIILDEIDGVLKKGDSLADFFQVLRRMENEKFARVIICGYRRLRDLSQDLEHPLYNMFHFMTLDCLSDAAASQLIRTPLTSLGVGFDGKTDSIIRQILTRTSSHPGAIQFFCHELLRRLNKSGKRTITAIDVDAVDESKAFEDYVLAGLRKIPMRDKKLLRCHTTRDQATLNQIALNCDGVLDREEVNAAVASLVDYMILLEAVSGSQTLYRYAQPVIAKLIRRHKLPL